MANSPSNRQEHAYMKMRQQALRGRGMTKAEEWVYQALMATGLKWTREAVWGWRIFDFWNVKLGVAIEVDGPEHNRISDLKRDSINYERSGIIVFRIKNWNQQDLEMVLKKLPSINDWIVRREELGLLTKAQKKARALY